MKVLVILVTALAATALAFPQSNVANQQTNAVGGAASAVIADGKANAGDTVPVQPVPPVSPVVPVVPKPVIPIQIQPLVITIPDIVVPRVIVQRPQIIDQPLVIPSSPLVITRPVIVPSNPSVDPSVPIGPVPSAVGTGNNVASQQTTATGGVGSTVIGNGVAQAGDVSGRVKRQIFPGSNIASQSTTALGGFGSTVFADGSALAGNVYLGRDKRGIYPHIIVS